MNESGKRLEALKKQHGLTNEKIGEWFGLTGQSIQLWIVKGIPNKRFDELARRFNVSKRWLMLGENRLEEQTPERQNQSTKEIAVRLIEERTRKNLSQFDMAQKTGYSIETIKDFEFADTELTSEFIKHLSAQGFDLNYIFSGHRSASATGADTPTPKNINQSSNTIGDSNHVNMQNFNIKNSD